jgi:predicted nucleic acid-binding protein
LALLIDTSVFIAIERSGQGLDVLSAQLGGESVAIAAITASELLHGVHRAIIGAHDLLIAATALAHDLILVTGNVRHFGRIESLKLSVW